MGLTKGIDLQLMPSVYWEQGERGPEGALLLASARVAEKCSVKI